MGYFFMKVFHLDKNDILLLYGSLNRDKHFSILDKITVDSNKKLVLSISIKSDIELVESILKKTNSSNIQ